MIHFLLHFNSTVYREFENHCNPQNRSQRAVCGMIYNKIYARRNPLETCPTSLTNGCGIHVCILRFILRVGTRDNEFNSGPNQEIINKIILWNTMLRRPSRRRFRCVVLLCYTFPAKIIYNIVYRRSAPHRVYYTYTAFRIDNLSAFKSLHFWRVLFSLATMIIIINVWPW